MKENFNMFFLLCLLQRVGQADRYVVTYVMECDHTKQDFSEVNDDPERMLVQNQQSLSEEIGSVVKRS